MVENAVPIFLTFVKQALETLIPSLCALPDTVRLNYSSEDTHNTLTEFTLTNLKREKIRFPIIFVDNNPLFLRSPHHPLPEIHSNYASQRILHQAGFQKTHHHPLRHLRRRCAGVYNPPP